MKNELTNALIAIDKFVTENNNFETIEYYHRFLNKNVFVPRFIVETHWSCNTEHMIDKWHETCNSTNYYGFFIKFYCELDTDNREAFVAWLLANRHSRYED